MMFSYKLIKIFGTNIKVLISRVVDRNWMDHYYTLLLRICTFHKTVGEIDSGSVKDLTCTVPVVWYGHAQEPDRWWQVEGLRWPDWLPVRSEGVFWDANRRRRVVRPVSSECLPVCRVWGRWFPKVLSLRSEMDSLRWNPPPEG